MLPKTYPLFLERERGRIQETESGAQLLRRRGGLRGPRKRAENRERERGGGGAASTGNAVFSVSRLAPQSPRWPPSSAFSRRFPEKALLPWEHTSNYSACRKSLSANLAGTRRFYRANTASWLDLRVTRWRKKQVGALGHQRGGLWAREPFPKPQAGSAVSTSRCTSWSLPEESGAAARGRAEAA